MGCRPTPVRPVGRCRDGIGGFPAVDVIHIGQEGRPGTKGAPGPRGPEGPMGPQGPAGEPSLVTKIAAVPLSALVLVSESGNGCRPLDPMDEDSVLGLVGITVTSAQAQREIKVKSTSGDFIDDSAWNWKKGLVFAGPNGTLTQTPPTVGWEIVVGFSPKPTRINLSYDEPIQL